MNSKTQHHISTAVQAGLAFFLAWIVFKMTLIFFIVPFFLWRSDFPEWIIVGLALVGVSLGLFAGYKCFRWFLDYFRKHQIFYHE